MENKTFSFFSYIQKHWALLVAIWIVADIVLLSLAPSSSFTNVRLIDLPPDIYHLEYLPAVIRWTEWSAIALMAFVICFLATVGPAIQVSRRSPVEGLRWT